MMKEKRQKVIDWHTANYNTPFVLKDEIKRYCKNDVEILLHALVKFRALIRSIAKDPLDDVLYYNTTLAGAALRDWRASCMPNNSVPLVNERGYGDFINQSTVALKMLRWIVRTREYQGFRFRDNGEQR